MVFTALETASFVNWLVCPAIWWWTSGECWLRWTEITDRDPRVHVVHVFPRRHSRRWLVSQPGRQGAVGDTSYPHLPSAERGPERAWPKGGDWDPLRTRTLTKHAGWLRALARPSWTACDLWAACIWIGRWFIIDRFWRARARVYWWRNTARERWMWIEGWGAQDAEISLYAQISRLPT